MSLFVFVLFLFKKINNPIKHATWQKDQMHVLSRVAFPASAIPTQAMAFVAGGHRLLLLRSDGVLQYIDCDAKPRVDANAKVDVAKNAEEEDDDKVAAASQTRRGGVDPAVLMVGTMSLPEDAAAGFGKSVPMLTTSSDGQWAAMALDGVAHVFQLDAFQYYGAVEGIGRALTAMAFRPDTAELALVCTSNQVRR
jgi:hypothetical protein